jgi:hypothetical protein
MRENRSPQNSLPPCFIAFQVTDQERFHTLVHAFEILKQEKLKQIAPMFENDAEEYNTATHTQTLRSLVDILFDLFDEQALAHFWWPSKQECQDHWRRWQVTPAPQRLTDPTLNHLWDFESMIDCFLNGEYELVACRLLTSDTGILEFSLFRFPFGGTGCMKALVEAFGCQVIGKGDGTDDLASFHV